jgi:hypothetical protein
MSVVAFGTVCGLQFAAVFQSPLVGFVAHVALPAKEGRCAAKSSSAAAVRQLNVFIRSLIRCPDPERCPRDTAGCSEKGPRRMGQNRLNILRERF